MPHTTLGVHVHQCCQCLAAHKQAGTALVDAEVSHTHPIQVGMCLAACCVPQVTAQRDGARLLVTLESKQAERLDAAVQRFQTLLQPGAVIGVQQDVSSLSGQAGKHSGSLPLSPVPQQQPGSAFSRAGGSTPSTAEGTGVQQMCGVQQAAAAVGLVAGVDAAGAGTAAATDAGGTEQVLLR